jgi:hypothetical protein
MPTAIPLTSPRHPSNSFSLSPLCYHDDDTEQSPYRFTVIREEPRESFSSTWCRSSHSFLDCRWHLPLWLLFFGVTVSILTLLFLLTGTVYPIHGWWTRYGSQSLGVLKIAGGIYRTGHPPSAMNEYPLAPISYVEPGHIFARSTRNGEFTIPSTVMRRPSKSGPASLVDNSVRANWSAGGRCRGRCSFFRRNFVSNIAPRSFPCLSRSAYLTHHVMRDVRSHPGSRSRDASSPREGSHVLSCGLWQA